MLDLADILFFSVPVGGTVLAALAVRVFYRRGKGLGES